MRLCDYVSGEYSSAFCVNTRMFTDCLALLCHEYLVEERFRSLM